MSQLPPGYVRYAEAYPPELRYLYQPAPLPRRRRTWLKVTLAVLAVLVVTGAGLGYWAVRPFLAQYPSTLTTPDSVAGMPRLTDARVQAIGDEMTGFLGNRAGADSSIAAFYAPDGRPDQAVMVYAGTSFVFDPGVAVNDAFAGMATGGLAVTDLTPTGPGVLGGVATCGRTQTASVPVAVCIWGDHGSVGVVAGFSRTVAETGDLLRTIRPLVLHRH